MPVNRSDIVKSQFLKQGSRKHHSLKMFVCPYGKFLDFRQRRQGFSPLLQHIVVRRSTEPHGHMFGQTPNAFRNTHFIIIQNDEYIFIKVTCMIHCFESHAAGQSPVTYDSNNLLVIFLNSVGDCQSQSFAYGSTCMTRGKHIIFTFLSPQERMKSVFLTYGFQQISSSC